MLNPAILENCWTPEALWERRQQQHRDDTISSLTRLPGTLADITPIQGVTVLGIGHKARHGKDTAAALMHSFTPDSQVMSFADDLKALCRAFFGMSTKDGNLLQSVGASVREVDPDHWVKALYARINERRPKLVLIPDMRYWNETEFVLRMGGSLLKVERYNADGSEFRDPTRSATHHSETDLDTFTGWNYVLRNARSAMEFEGAVSNWWNAHATELL